MRLHQNGRPALPTSVDRAVDVLLLVLWELQVGVVALRDDAVIEIWPDFFICFTSRALEDGLAVFHVTARHAPQPSPASPFALAEKDLVVDPAELICVTPVDEERDADLHALCLISDQRAKLLIFRSQR